MDELTFSKLLLGNKYRLTIGSDIAVRSGAFTCREIAKDLGLADSLVTNELSHLGDAGIIERLPKSGQAQYYERIDHPYWQCCLALVASMLPAREP